MSDTWLRFVRHGEKWYAQTPSGEFAFSDRQGLYEWRNGERIDYTDGDRQAAKNGRRLTVSGTPSPQQRGLIYALAPWALP